MSAQRFKGALVLLDADVLYPIRVCDFVLTASSVRLLARPVVSDMILLEAQRNVAADRPDLSEEQIGRRFANVRAVTDGNSETLAEWPGISLVNPKDRHVLSAALHHDVEFVVSNDVRLRREIETWLGQTGESVSLRGAVSADELAAGLVDESPDDVVAAITAMSRRFRNPTRTFAETLRSLSDAMPSLSSIDSPP